MLADGGGAGDGAEGGGVLCAEAAELCGKDEEAAGRRIASCE